MRRSAFSNCAKLQEQDRTETKDSLGFLKVSQKHFAITQKNPLRLCAIAIEGVYRLLMAPPIVSGQIFYMENFVAKNRLSDSWKMNRIGRWKKQTCSLRQIFMCLMY